MRSSLRELLPATDETSPDRSVHLAMAYICECGTKWTKSRKPTWECRCGRQLTIKNGVIHAAIRPRSGLTGSAQVVQLAAG